MKQATIQRTKWQRQAEWAALRRWHRTEVSRVLRDIERGMVNEIDLAKLNNFCMTALMVQAKVEETTWRAAERDAEMASLLRGEDVEQAADLTPARSESTMEHLEEQTWQ